ncbi:MAG: hypothetical protein KBB13_04940 [Anaerolineaceae bacterium]|nr:hypothetical protein [Anaerolineaceae bacterium]
MKKTLNRLALFTLISALLVACAGSAPQPTASPTIANTPTVLPPTDTPAPTLTATHTEVPTETATPTRTKVPFAGFMQLFSLYRAWSHEGKTYFYFLQSNFPGTMYARADSYDLVCNPDPKYPLHMQCESEQEIFGQDEMTFTFFTDEDRQDLVHTQKFLTGLVNDIVYYHNTDCPDRGKNVHCESEYRLYDGRCYYAHTCYDDCGLYYSRDNIPEVWNEFQGFTTPCN